MRVIKRLHYGGTTIDFIDTCVRSAFPVHMQIVNSKVNHTLALNTEILNDLRHALRQASKVARIRERDLHR